MKRNDKYQRLLKQIHRLSNSFFFKNLYSTLNDFNSHRCVICEDPSNDRLCKFCETLLEKPQAICQSCGVPLLNEAIRCGQCLRKPPSFDRVIAPYLYQKPLQQLIYTLKENENSPVSKALANRLIHHLRHYYQQQHNHLPDIMTPVPLHWQRQWQRGFNQSSVLCHYLSRAFNIPIHPIFECKRKSKKQKLLNKQERLTNLRNTYRLNKGLSLNAIAHKHIVIVDDVVTTTATAETLAKLLKQFKVKEVTVWAIARTPRII